MTEYINYHYNAECQVCFESGLLVYDGLCINCIYDFLVQQPLTNHFHSKVFKSFDLLYYTSIDDKITNLVIEQLKNKINHDVELNFKGYIDRKVKEFKDDFGINVVIKYNKTKLDYYMKINDDKFDDLTNEDYDKISRYLNSYKQHRIMSVQHDQLVECIIEEINFVLMCCPMDELHTIYDVLFKNVKRFAEKKCMYNLTDQIIIYLIYETSRNYLLKRDNLVAVIQFIDGRHDVQKNDLQMRKWVEAYNLPIFTIVTKIDYIPRSKVQKVVSDVKKQLGGDVLPFSSADRFYCEKTIEYLLNLCE